MDFSCFYKQLHSIRLTVTLLYLIPDAFVMFVLKGNLSKSGRNT